MTNWKKYQNKVRKNISKLAFDRKLQFAIQICERLFPDYVNFQKQNEFGNPSLLRKGIDFGHENLSLENVGKDEITSLISQIEAVTPDADDFGEIDGSLALNAACSILDMLNFILSSNEEYIFNVANYMYDSVDFIVADKYPNLNEEEIQNHPLIIEEVRWQLEQTQN